MTDPIQAARADLAFLRAITEDRGALPAQLGAHLLAIGAIYGTDFLLVWALFAGVVPRPAHDPWLLVSWLPATIVYVPVNLWIGRHASATPGPSARMAGAAWGAMAIMTLVAVLVVIVASARAGLPYYEIWPALGFVLYGGAWAAAAIVRRNRGHALVAAGCFAVAFAAAALVHAAEGWLVMAGGFFLLLALPGVVIVREARGAERRAGVA